jgi:hypothetical protein
LRDPGKLRLQVRSARNVGRVGSLLALMIGDFPGYECGLARTLALPNRQPALPKRLARVMLTLPRWAGTPEGVAAEEDRCVVCDLPMKTVLHRVEVRVSSFLLAVMPVHKFVALSRHSTGVSRTRTEMVTT